MSHAFFCLMKNTPYCDICVHRTTFPTDIYQTMLNCLKKGCSCPLARWSHQVPMGSGGDKAGTPLVNENLKTVQVGSNGIFYKVMHGRMEQTTSYHEGKFGVPQCGRGTLWIFYLRQPARTLH